jgi:hypothetical protein
MPSNNIIYRPSMANHVSLIEEPKSIPNHVSNQLGHHHIATLCQEPQRVQAAQKSVHFDTSIQPEIMKKQPPPLSKMDPTIGTTSAADVMSGAPPLPTSPPPHVDSPVDDAPETPTGRVNGDAAALAGLAGMTLEDADTTLHNTPNVIGAQEVYRDPRERMMQEKLKRAQGGTSASQGPEELSFREKIAKFAMSNQSLGDKNKKPHDSSNNSLDS